jgi:hypothetical protein
LTSLFLAVVIGVLFLILVGGELWLVLGWLVKQYGPRGRMTP